MGTSWEDVVAFGAELPKVEQSMSYGTPALKVAGKLIARLRNEAEGGLVPMCSVGEKEALLASKNPAFYSTPRYCGHGSIIVDLDLVDRDELHEMVVEAWRSKAPKTVRKQYDGTD